MARPIMRQRANPHSSSEKSHARRARRESASTTKPPSAINPVGSGSVVTEANANLLAQEVGEEVVVKTGAGEFVWRVAKIEYQK